jgi:hypothetical protein
VVGLRYLWCSLRSFYWTPNVLPQLMFHNNPAYTLKHTEGIYRFYIPANDTEYHTSRHVEATRQATYAAAGANQEVINAHLDAIIGRCNMAMPMETRTTDIAQIAGALKYRTKYPVDAHCGIRMGAILSFMEYDETELVKVDNANPPMEVKTGRVISEDPQKTEEFWLLKKEKLAFDHPALYSFFLTWGASNVPQWSQHLDSLAGKEYFLNRQETIRAMIPMDLLSQLTQ